MKSSTCFATVIFQKNLPFFKDFLSSLSNQSFKDFSLLIFNEDVQDMESHLADYQGRYEVIPLIENQGIHLNRTQLLNYLKQSEYQYCVFGDSDDYFSENRIELSLKYLKDFDLVSVQLCLVDENNAIMQPDYLRIPDGKRVAFEDVIDGNFCGLGNTAIRISALPDNVIFESNILAVDWLLFSRMLIENKTGVFTNQSYIYYRQHGANLISLSNAFRSKILNGIKVKLAHYESVFKEYQLCENEWIQLKELSEFCSNSKNLELYLQKAQALNIPNPNWCEEVKTLQYLKMK